MSNKPDYANRQENRAKLMALEMLVPMQKERISYPKLDNSE